MKAITQGLKSLQPPDTPLVKVVTTDPSKFDNQGVRLPTNEEIRRASQPDHKPDVE